MRATISLLSVLISCSLLSCSAGAVSEEWGDWVSEHNSCSFASDCELVFPGCPLGCGTAVSASEVSAARDLSDQLIRRYEIGGAACAYRCLSVTVACEEGACVALSEDP